MLDTNDGPLELGTPGREAVAENALCHVQVDVPGQRVALPRSGGRPGLPLVPHALEAPSLYGPPVCGLVNLLFTAP